MFYNINTTYTGADATFEILVMLSVAFLFGVLFRYILMRKRILSLKARNQALEGERELLERQNQHSRSRLLEVEEQNRKLEELLVKERSIESEAVVLDLLRKSV